MQTPDVGPFIGWVSPDGRPTRQAKGRHYRRIGTVGFRRSSRRLGSTGPAHWDFWGKPWWVVDLRLTTDKPGLALICFWLLGKFEASDLGALVFSNASNCPNCNVLRGRFFFLNTFTQPDMNEAGQIWDNFSNLSPTWQGTSPWKWTYTYCTLLFSGTAKCCIVAWLSLFLWYVYNMSTTCLLYPYYIRLYRPLFLLVNSIFCWIHKPRNPWKISTFYPSNQVKSCYPLVN